MRAGKVVLATGTIEQPLVFANNDRPGIMLAGAARQYLRRYGVFVGAQVLIATNNDSAYALAPDLKQAGVRVVGVADSRHQVPQALRAAMQLLGVAALYRLDPDRHGRFLSPEVRDTGPVEPRWLEYHVLVRN